MASILVVEDNYETLELLDILLRHGGFEVWKTMDAKEALALLDQGKNPDLIILDNMLPETSGTILCQMLRQRESTAHTPILMLSAVTDMESIKNGLAAGADDYLTKPILRYDLAAKMRSMLGSTHSAPSKP